MSGEIGRTSGPMWEANWTEGGVDRGRGDGERVDGEGVNRHMNKSA